MKVDFIKMHGLENDFVLIDATKKSFGLPRDYIQQIANRRTGIGFDQLLVLETSTQNNADYVYRIFNADGLEVEQCGNGARCVAHYIFSEHLSQKGRLTLATLGGLIEVACEESGQIKVNMGIPMFEPAKIPFLSEHEQPVYELTVAGQILEFGVVSMGNPHMVTLVKDIDAAPVAEVGAQLQHHLAFPNRVNVGFMQIEAPDRVRLRVYERGVGETRSCGTGACAAVAVGRVVYSLAERVRVVLSGGELTIDWAGPGRPLYMTGPAIEVFRGQFSV